MSLQRAVAAPFQTTGVDRLSHSEFTVALSLDLKWFSPEQAERLADRAVSEGLLERSDDDVIATFDPQSVDVPNDFEPDEGLLQQRSVFERVLDSIVDTGIDKQTAVAEINKLQSRTEITIEAAAALYATQQAVDVTSIASTALDDLE